MKIHLFFFVFPFTLVASTHAVGMDMKGMDHSGEGMNMPSRPSINSTVGNPEKAINRPKETMKEVHIKENMTMDDMGGMSDMEGMEDMPGMADTHRMKRSHQNPPRNASGSTTAPTIDRAAIAKPVKTPRIVHKAVDAPAPVVDLGHHIHGMDMGKWFHGVLDEFEGRYQGGGNSSLRWDGEAWYGGDYNRLWLKSEGTMTRGRVHDGDQELLYSRAISTYFNLQGGVRLDLDSGPTRAWGAVGVEGLALYQFEVQATGYFNDRGVAGRLEGSYDILLTNRLILQPQVELNFYSHADRQRLVGSGLADIDTGLRLRYELWRKMAPYVAVTYDSPLMQGRHMARQQGEQASEARFTFGIRSWF